MQVDFGKLCGKLRACFAAFQLCANTLCDLNRIEVVVEILHRVVFLYQPERGFFAYSRDAGDIVRAVAHKRFHFKHFCGRNAVYLADFLRGVDDVLLV